MAHGQASVPKPSSSQSLPVPSCPSRGFLASALQGHPGDEGLEGPQGPQGPYVSTGTKQRGLGCPLLPICTLWVPPTTRAGALKRVGLPGAAQLSSCLPLPA